MKKTAFFLLGFALPGLASAGTTAFAFDFTDAYNEGIWVQYTGQCYEVKIKDSGSQTPLSSDLTVHLTAASGSFYSNSNCTTSITSVTIPASSTSATAYFKSTSAGTIEVTLKASVDELTPELEDYIVVVAMSQLGFNPSMLTQTVGTCGALKIEAQDNSGQTVDVDSVLGTVDVDLDTDSSTGAFYSDSSCASKTESVSLKSGSNSVTVYYKDTTAQDLSGLSANGIAQPEVSTGSEMADPYMVMGEGNATITSSDTSN